MTVSNDDAIAVLRIELEDIEAADLAARRGAHFDEPQGRA